MKMNIKNILEKLYELRNKDIPIFSSNNLENDIIFKESSNVADRSMLLRKKIVIIKILISVIIFFCTFIGFGLLLNKLFGKYNNNTIILPIKSKFEPDFGKISKNGTLSKENSSQSLKTPSTLTPNQNQKDEELLSNEIFLSPKIYYYINVTNYMRTTNIEVKVILELLKESIPRLHQMGITDLIVDELSFDLSHPFTNFGASEFIAEANLHNIRVNLMLNTQFSTPMKKIRFLPDYLYKKNRLGNLVMINGRYLYNDEEIKIENYFKRYFGDLSDLGIGTFFFSENPYKIISKNRLDFRRSDTISSEYLERRFKTIKLSKKQAKIFYSYKNDVEKDMIQSFNLSFDGGLLYLNETNRESLKSDINILERIFKKVKNEDKVLLFDFRFDDSKLFHMKFLLGFYLFSPIPIVLNLKDEDGLPYCINIFFDKHRQMDSQEIKIYNLFIEIVRKKKKNPYFHLDSSLILPLHKYKDIIIIRRGQIINSIVSRLLIYIYNGADEEETISLVNLFNIEKSKELNLLYNNYDPNTEINLDREKMTIKPKQLILLKIID